MVGYQKPNNLPDNFHFVSMGIQRGPKYFSDDLAAYFSKQNETFVWLMEDTLVKAPLKIKEFEICKSLAALKDIGRVSLTNNSHKFYTNGFYSFQFGVTVLKTPADSDYRLSIQPAIWKRDYLLKYLTPGLSPWDFECQNGNLMQMPDHDYHNVSLVSEDVPLSSNEGVRKRDIHAFDLNGIDKNVIAEMKQLNIL